MFFIDFLFISMNLYWFPNIFLWFPLMSLDAQSFFIDVHYLYWWSVICKHFGWFTVDFDCLHWTSSIQIGFVFTYISFLKINAFALIFNNFVLIDPTLQKVEIWLVFEEDHYQHARHLTSLGSLALSGLARCWDYWFLSVSHFWDKKVDLALRL